MAGTTTLGRQAAQETRDISWAEMYAHRRRIERRFGEIHRLPLVARCSRLLLRHVRSDDRVLEVGAGDRRMAEHLRARWPNVRYESLDIDPAGRHDYRNLAEVSGRYDVVFAFEVVEHLPVEQIGPWLRRLADLLNPSGKLLLSTPNVFCPPAYLRDATHRTPLCYDELGGFVEAAGLHVTHLYRVYHEALHRVVLRRFVFGGLFRILRLDFARQIALVAEKSAA